MNELQNKQTTKQNIQQKRHHISEQNFKQTSE